MKVLFDHQVFSWQKTGGVSRYFTELMTKMIQKKINIFLSGIFTENIYIKKINNSLKKVTNYYIPGKTILIKKINKISTINTLNKNNFDIIHPTGYDPYVFKYLKKSKLIITIHDMIYEKFPEYFPKSGAENKKKMILSADAIIAVSNKTKEDIISLLKVNPKNIYVVHQGGLMGGKNEVKNSENPLKYFLYVGDRDKYKNFSLLIEEIKYVLKKNKKIKILCVGGGKFKTKELDLMGEFKNRFIQLNLTDKELIWAYRHALALIITSLYEGFGIPVIEAMSLECPVILNKTSSLPEVAGDAGLYYDSNKKNDLKNKINYLLNKPKQKKELIRKGYLRAKKFSWEKCVEETVSVYKKVLKEK